MGDFEGVANIIVKSLLSLDLKNCLHMYLSAPCILESQFFSGRKRFILVGTRRFGHLLHCVVIV